MSLRFRPWSAYGLRVLTCVLLFGVGYMLVSTSPFAARLRNDVPAFVPGLDGVRGLALVLSLVLSFAPLLARKRFLGALLVSGFILSGLGAYWWTRIPWDELIKQNDFPGRGLPGVLEFVLAAAPALLAAFYAVASRWSVQRADHLRRGADRDEAARAAAASFLAGAAALGIALVLSGVLWLMLSGDALTFAHPLTGPPAILAVAALALGAYLFARREHDWQRAILAAKKVAKRKPVA